MNRLYDLEHLGANEQISGQSWHLSPWPRPGGFGLGLGVVMEKWKCLLGESESDNDTYWRWDTWANSIVIVILELLGAHYRWTVSPCVPITGMSIAALSSSSPAMSPRPCFSRCDDTLTHVLTPNISISAPSYEHADDTRSLILTNTNTWSPIEMNGLKCFCD